jgi:hypothetical protein
VPADLNRFARRFSLGARGFCSSRRLSSIVAGVLVAAALITGLLALVRLVEAASSNPRAVALAWFFGAVTALLGAGVVVARAPLVRALLAVAGAGAAAAMTLAGALSFGSLFVLTFLLWLASAVLLCRITHPRRLAVAAAAVWGLAAILLALPVIVAVFPIAR